METPVLDHVMRMVHQAIADNRGDRPTSIVVDRETFARMRDEAPLVCHFKSEDVGPYPKVMGVQIIPSGKRI